MNLRRLFLYLLIASIGLSAVIGIGVILFGNFGEIEIRILFTTLTVTVTSIFGSRAVRTSKRVAENIYRSPESYSR
jgi:hypothetical protein